MIIKIDQVLTSNPIQYDQRWIQRRGLIENSVSVGYRTDRQTDGWTHRQTDRRVDTRTDRQLAVYVKVRPASL